MIQNYTWLNFLLAKSSQKNEILTFRFARFDSRKINLVETMGAKETSQTLFCIIHFNNGSLGANLYATLFSRDCIITVLQHLAFSYHYRSYLHSFSILNCFHHLPPSSLFPKGLQHHLEYQLKMQILGCYPYTTESESIGLDLGICIFTAHWVILMQVKVWELLVNMQDS